MRAQFVQSLTTAMKSGDKRRVSTLRMVQAALKDKDIEARGLGKEPLSDDDILSLLQKMIKQRQESLGIYEKAGRAELANQEREEIDIISSFLPQPLSEEETKTAIAAAIRQSGAASVKDMGKVIALLKSSHAGRMDFARASGWVKETLAG